MKFATTRYVPLMILMLLSMAMLPAQPVSASYEDAVLIDWRSQYDNDSSQYSFLFNEYANQGYYPTSFEMHNSRRGGIWHANLDGRSWQQRSNASESSFDSHHTSNVQSGRRLIDFEPTQGTFAGIWIYNTEGYTWDFAKGLTESAFNQRNITNTSNGNMPVDIEIYDQSGTMRYAGIWRENTQNDAWFISLNQSPADFHQLYRQNQSAYRILDFESYLLNGEQVYSAIWVGRGTQGWRLYHDMTLLQFQNIRQIMTTQGYRLDDYEVYTDGLGDTRYASVWVQNGTTPPVWDYAYAVDRLTEEMVNTYEVPAVSVAIYHQGQVVYTKNMGYANLASQTPATDNTIYRIASLSKALGGALALDLEERGYIDMETQALFYTPVPNNHTYTVGMLASNRSGIGHYAELGSPSSSASFDTAFAAMQFFIDEPLVATPGTNYHYSTHAFTTLGAAIEGAMPGSDGIADIFESEFTQRYGLGTLRPEDRSVSNANRATLYDWTGSFNAVATPDNISWKVLGGGLESTASDYASFLGKMFAGNILGSTALNKWWTAPDGLASYAYGVFPGSAMCADGTSVPRLAHSGSQLGSNTGFRAVPDEDLAIVVLTNRSDGGHSAAGLAYDINYSVAQECDFEPSDTSQPADIDGNGTVTPLEAMYVINRFDSGDMRADLNGDFTIDGKDAQVALNQLGQ